MCISINFNHCFALSSPKRGCLILLNVDDLLTTGAICSILAFSLTSKLRASSLPMLVTWAAFVSDVFNFIPKEELLDGMISSDDDINAPFHLQTFIEAKPGKMIKGEDIANIVKEHNETKIPFAVLAKKLDANTKVMISPNKLVEPVLRDESEKGR